MPLCEVVIVDQKPVSGGYCLLRLAAPEPAAAAQPGQFIHLRIPGLETTALRRPFSIYRAADGELAILYKRVGRGTDVLAALPAGTRLSLMGPLGNGFPLAAGDGPPILVGGGYGVAPLVFLASRLPCKGVVLLGGRRAADVLCADDFAALGWPVEVATQDGSLGTEGLVTDLLDRHLAAEGPRPELFACGPDGMLRAVGSRAIAAGCRAWLSLDHHMVCGIGACLACVQQVRGADGGIRIARVCKDGPIFEARDIIWEDPA
jgi:dihydroorotate dehydrogenase electron transfer subunit